MKYTELISNHLAGSKESVGDFAKRIGVSRSTVYRAMSDDYHVLFHLVEKIVRACGGDIVIVTPQDNKKNN